MGKLLLTSYPLTNCNIVEVKKGREALFYQGKSCPLIEQGVRFSRVVYSILEYVVDEEPYT